MSPSESPQATPSALEQPTPISPTASTSALASPAEPAAADPAADASANAKSYPPSATALLMAENPTLSRSAAKKLLREQAWAAGKADRRAKEREKNKAKAAEKRKLIDEGVLERPAKKGRQAKREEYGARVVVDLGFDDLMIDKEVKSMCSQLAYCYAANRAAASPVPLLFTSYNKRLRDKLEGQPGQSHKAWKGVEWWEEDYTRLWKGKQAETDAEAGTADAVSTDAPPASATDTAPSDPATAPAPTATAAASPSSVPDPVLIGALSGQPRASAPQSKVVYLTGDSPNVLSTLDAGTTYILGGIVDHNRYKNLCLDKANADGLAHAQLPIGDFLPEMRTRKVLTVNQVFEIIVEWVGGRVAGEEAGEGWRRAFGKVIPLRKMDENHRTNKKGGDEDGEEEAVEAGGAGGLGAAAEVVVAEDGKEATGGEEAAPTTEAASTAVSAV